MFAILAAFVSVLSQSSAAVLVYDGFDYGTTGQSLSAIASPGGLGLSGAWSANSGNATITDGLSFAHLATGGNAVAVSSRSTTGFGVSGRAISPDANLTSGTLFMSFLFNSSSPLTNDKLFFSGISNNISESSLDYRPLISVLRPDSPNLGVGNYPGAANNTAYGTAPTQGTTYLTIATVSNLSTSPTSHTVTAWVLSEAQWSSIYDQTITTDLLSANSIGAITSTFSNYTNYFTNYIMIGSNSGGNTASKTVIFDELRYGTSFADILPVPEPSSLAVLSLGIIMLLFNRRRSAP